MSFSSMQYTIGTALERAREQGHSVGVLVEGQWLTGMVVASDGIGVVLENDELEHTIVKLEKISAVRVESAAPMRRKIPAHASAGAAAPGFDSRSFDGAMPMPGPRHPTD